LLVGKSYKHNSIYLMIAGKNTLLLLTDNWLLEMLSLLIVVNVSSLLEICHFKCINVDISLV